MKIFLLVAFLGFAIYNVKAQKLGSLDSSYGEGGKVINMNGLFRTISSGVMQPDNKMIISSSTFNSFVLQRYQTNGYLDSAFGNNGTALLEVGKPESTTTNDVALTSDGKIIVAGIARYLFSTGIGFLLARSTANGKLDSSFGNNGLVIDTSNLFAVNDYPSSVAIQSDGRIVVTGNRLSDLENYTKTFVTKRYLPNGALDASFGNNGTVITDLTGWDRTTSVICQSDGKIVVGGVFDDISYADNLFALVRYMPDGSIDETFGSEGKVVTDFGKNGEVINSLALQDDGKIIAAGTGNYNVLRGYSYMAVARYNVDGSLDASFGNNGKSTVAFENINAEAKSLQIQNNKKIVLTGVVYKPRVDADFAITRLLSNGFIDSAFGNNGITTTDFNNNSDDGSIASGIQTDGNIVLAGTEQVDAEVNVALARYYGDPVKQLGPIAKRIRRWIRNHTLQWQPLNDNDIAYYSIQQSSNGVSRFKEIGRIAANRQSSNVYSYNLNNSSSNTQPSATYYRVTAVSNSGDNIVSDVIADENAFTVTVSPNPVKDVLKISGLPAIQKTVINVVNRNGNVLQSATAQSSSYNMNVSQLKSGVYNVVVTINNKTQSIKFVKE